MDFRPPEPGEHRGQATFDLLGFTFHWSRCRRGRPVIALKTARDRLSRKLREMGQWCRQNRHRPLREQHQTLRAKIQGHLGYFAVSFNYRSLQAYRRGVWRRWRYWLNRRGSPRLLSWERFGALLVRLGPPRVRILHDLLRPLPVPPHLL